MNKIRTNKQPQPAHRQQRAPGGRARSTVPWSLCVHMMRTNCRSRAQREPPPASLTASLTRSVESRPRLHGTRGVRGITPSTAC